LDWQCFVGGIAIDISANQTRGLDFKAHFNTISTPFQRHFNTISTQFQHNFNAVLTLF